MTHISIGIALRFTAVAIGALIVVMMVAFAVAPAKADTDQRQLITLSPDIRDRFLAEMRHDLFNLSEVVSAIADQNFEAAAKIAERRMGLGHVRIRNLENSGATDAEIAAEIVKIRVMAEQHGADLPNVMKQRGMGRGGVGRFMPEELRAIGQAFHKTAYPLADAARAVGDKPTPETYQRLFSALSDMTSSCLGCHEVYRVK